MIFLRIRSIHLEQVHSETPVHFTKCLLTKQCQAHKTIKWFPARYIVFHAFMHVNLSGSSGLLWSLRRISFSASQPKNISIDAQLVVKQFRLSPTFLSSAMVSHRCFLVWLTRLGKYSHNDIPFPFSYQGARNMDAFLRFTGRVLFFRAFLMLWCEERKDWHKNVLFLTTTTSKVH